MLKNLFSLMDFYIKFFINEKAIDEIFDSFKSIEVSDDIKIQQIS